MNRHLTIGQRWRVSSLRLDQGLGFREIARRMNCTHQTVHNILQLFHETKDVLERDGRGTSNSLTNHEIHVLRQILHRYSYETATQLNNRFYRRTGRAVAPRTIRNYRRRLHFRAVQARVQPLLTQAHAYQRLTFCRQHIYDDWRRVIFADEKVFEADATGIVYWIPYGPPRPTTFRSQVQYNGAVFGAICYNKRSNITGGPE